MKIEPFGDKIIVRQKERKEQSKGGLIFTDSISDPPNEGLVIAISKDVKLDISIGDTLLYNKFAGALLEDNEIEYLILCEEDIYGRRIK